MRPKFDPGLRPLKGKIHPMKIFAFDVETYNNNKDLLCVSLVGDNYCKFFNDVESFKEEILNNRGIFRNCYICASNLMFDFFTVFPLSEVMAQFNIIERQSSLIMAKTYINYKGVPKFHSKASLDSKNEYLRHNKQDTIDIGADYWKITFIDSMNHHKRSVEDLGLCITKCPDRFKCSKRYAIDENMTFFKSCPNSKRLNFMCKLHSPSFLGNKWTTKEEYKEMRTYNIRDSEVTFYFMSWLQNEYNKLGANMKITISSSSMDLYRRKYLDGMIKQEPKDNILTQYKAYYGGRTEAFKRGIFTSENYAKIHVYDVNCFSEDTEILTTEGFKSYSQINNYDLVYSMVDNELRICAINDIIIKQYSGNMVRLQNENTDQLVTSNHRVYYKDYNRTQWHKDKGCYGWSKDYKVKDAIDIPATYIKFPNAKIYSGHISVNTDRLRLASWYITEGHLCKDNVEISQSWTHNPQKCEEILELLRRLDIPYKRKDRYQKNKKYLYITFKFTEIEDIMHKKYYNSYEMRLPSDFMEYTLACKKILFDELMKGDGCYQQGKTSYVSYSDGLLNDFQILSTMIGLKCAIDFNYHVAYIKLGRSGDSVIKDKSIIQYSGTIWCVSVKYHNVVVRRNGKVFISGNSLYPYCLSKFEYPDPTSGINKDKVTTEDIERFMGLCHIEMQCPKDLNIPILPVKTDKLRFPTGTIKGWYDFNSLKKALDLNYEVVKIDEGIVYQDKYKPFKNFVDDLYKLRLKFQSEKNDAELAVKIMLNSFYGKFGYNYIHKEMLMDIFDMPINDPKYDIIPTKDPKIYRVISTQEAKVPAYVFPIFPLYVTSYAREVMYNKFKSTGFDRVLYTDTDCVFTTRKLSTSNDLGEFKLERSFNELAIIKPKMYSGIPDEGKDIIKVKGIHGTIKEYAEFKEMVASDKFDVKMKQFTKLRQSLGGKRSINSVYEMSKHLALVDNKRDWEKKYFTVDPQSSVPMNYTAKEYI